MAEDDDAYYQPEIFRPVPEDSGDWWPRMATVEADESLHAYLTTRNYGPPGRWLGMAAARHPELRFALLWIDTVFDNCGHMWAEGDARPLSLSLWGKDFDRFTDERRGWVGCLTDAVAWASQRCPPEVRIEFAAIDRLLAAFLGASQPHP